MRQDSLLLKNGVYTTTVNMKNNKSPIVRLGMEVSSSFDTTTTVEEHSQDLRSFLDGMSEDQKNNFRVAAEILEKNKKDCDQFEGRDGI